MERLSWFSGVSSVIKMVLVRETGRQESQRRCDDGNRSQKQRDREKDLKILYLWL